MLLPADQSNFKCRKPHEQIVTTGAGLSCWRGRGTTLAIAEAGRAHGLTLHLFRGGEVVRPDFCLASSGSPRGEPPRRGAVAAGAGLGFFRGGEAVRPDLCLASSGSPRGERPRRGAGAAGAGLGFSTLRARGGAWARTRWVSFSESSSDSDDGIVGPPRAGPVEGRSSARLQVDTGGPADHQPGGGCAAELDGAEYQPAGGGCPPAQTDHCCGCW